MKGGLTLREDLTKKTGANSQKISVNVNMYSVLPSDDIMMSKLLEICEKRLTLLRKIDDEFEGERCKDSSQHKFGAKFYEDLCKEIFENKKYTLEEEDDRQSHWALKLSFLNNSEWFVCQESNLFTQRIMSELLNIQKNGTGGKYNDGPKHRFLKNVISAFYEQVGYRVLEKSDSEYIDYKNHRDQYVKSLNSRGGDVCEIESERDFNQENDGKKMAVENDDKVVLIIPFEDACKLMADHKIIIFEGKGFVEGKDLEKIIKQLFERILRDDLKILNKHSDKVISVDERFENLIAKIPNMYTGKDYSNVDTTSVKNKINLAEIDALAAKNFPLCMSEMHLHLRKQHHLMHYGRIQYGLFLKGVGVKVKDAVQFFRGEFSKLNNNKLNEYIYLIEHMYGLKGKKTDYTPWGCEKLANSHPPGQGDTHGCPFAYYGEKALRDALRKKFAEPQVQEIVNATKDAGHQGGCKKMFFHMHPNAQIREGIGRHPNSYVDSSLYYKMSNLAKAHDKENLKNLEIGKKSPAEIHSTKSNEQGLPNGSALSNQTL